MSKIKILEIVSNLGYGGTQRTVINFSRYINRDFFDVFVIGYDKGGAREADLVNIPYLVANNNVEKIIDFIRINKIRILHFHRSGHYIEIEFKIINEVKKNFPEILIFETNIFGKFDAKCFPLIDCSLQISKMMMNERYIKKVGYFDYNRMKVLYNPVDYKSFTEIEITKEELENYKKGLGIKKGDFVIGKMGGPYIAKWSDLLVEMMPHLVPLISNIKFVIQAAPSSRKKRILRSKFAKRYILLDETSNEKEVAMFYKAIDVYVHASKIGESFGMTLAEAGLFKKPVVVNSTPNRDNNQVELVDHMKTGIIANNPQTFARAIYYLYINSVKRFEMGENASKKILSNYDPIKICNQFEKICIDFLKKDGVNVNPTALDFYSKIDYTPSENDIKKFKYEYIKILRNEFGVVTLFDRIYNLHLLPIRLFFKIRDSLEGRYGFRM